MKNSVFLRSSASVAGVVGAVFRTCTFAKDSIYSGGALMDNFRELEKPDDWIFVGLIERGDQVMIAGRPKAGKSLLASQIALAAASGGTFLKWQAAKPCKVLYINLEIRSKRFAGRLALQTGTTPEEIRRTRKVPRIIAEINKHNRLVPIHDFMTIDVLMDGGADVEAIRKKIFDYQPDLVVWDVLAHCHQSKENDADIKNVLLKIKELCGGKNGAASIVVHHTRKSPTDADDRPQTADDIRGNGAIVGAVDMAMVLSKRAGQGARYVLTWIARNVEEPPETPLFTKNLCFFDATEARMNAQVEAIRAAFARSEKLRSGELLDAVKDSLRCGRDIAYAAVTTAVNDGVLNRQRIGNAQIYSLAA